MAKSPPDGYTLLMGPSTLAINPAMYKKVPYDPVRDFAPITQVIAAPNMLVVHPSVPAKTVKELIAFARARAGPAQLRLRRDRHQSAPVDGAVPQHDRD